MSTFPEPEIPADAERGAEVARDDRAHVFHSWSAQALIKPLPIAGASGSHFWDFEGTATSTSPSQLVNVNIGYQHPKLVAAIQEAAARQCTIAPSFADESRSEAARLIAERPGDLDKVFFTNGGAEATENAMRMARLHTGRQKVLATYRGYHGATAGSITATGDPRRWPNEPGMPASSTSGVRTRTARPSTRRARPRSASGPSSTCGTSSPSRPSTIAALILETVVGTNGILVPPDGYLAGVARSATSTASCGSPTRSWPGSAGAVSGSPSTAGGSPRPHLLRQGRQLGLRPDRRRRHLGRDRRDLRAAGLPRWADLLGHPLACASAVASIRIFEEEGILENVLQGLRHGHRAAPGRDRREAPERRRGARARLFWALELVRDRATREPLVPYNAGGADAAPMNDFAACRAEGLWPFVHFNRTHVVPPCTTTADEMAEGLDMLDRALDVADQFTA